MVDSEGQSGTDGQEALGLTLWVVERGGRVLSLGLSKVGRSAQGGLWGRGNYIAMRWNEKGVQMRTHTACGSHRHRLQGKVAGAMGRRHEGVTHCLWELRGRQESERTPALQPEGMDQRCPRIKKGNKVEEGAEFLGE